MRWLIAVLVVVGCSSPAGAPDASGGDASSDSIVDTAPTLTWESVTEVANDGEVITEDVTYRSGGLLIRGHLCRPVAGGAHPAVIYNHGGFQGLAIDPEAQRCHETARLLGYVWLASSYRGEDGSEGQLEVCLGEVDDVLAMLAIAREQSYVDPDRIAMYGGSHGGCITERAVQRGAAVKVAVDLFGPTDWATLYAFWQSQGDSFSQQLMSVLRTAAGGTPADVPQAYALRSPITFVADFPAGVPFMVTHGTGDTVVPVAQSCALASASFPSWHIDANGAETAAVPAGCTGVPSMTTARPTNSWPGSRYLLIYDGLGHETASAAAMRMLQDAALFMMAKL